MLREVTVEDAAAIYHAIDTHRNYMRTWLPFVDNLKSVADEENFLKRVLSAPADSYEPIFGIWNRENEICGLIGFHFSDFANHRHGNRLLASARIPASGIMTDCVRRLCRWAVETKNNKTHTDTLCHGQCSKQRHSRQAWLPP